MHITIYIYIYIYIKVIRIIRLYKNLCARDGYIKQSVKGSLAEQQR